jgi:tRNA A-37 threonylcarbamoyl transferase component Bud32
MALVAEMQERDVDVIEEIVREHVRAGHGIHVGPTWLTVNPDGVRLAEHGWKLHVSSRSATFAELVERLLPRLLAEGCVFKLARSRRVLQRLNDGHSSPATVGKAFTIYPDQRRVRELGLELTEFLRGHQGPRVLSDRRVDQDAPVYYRYGPHRKPADSGRGRFLARIDGPDGEAFEGIAGLRYEQPAWAVDPFTGRRADEEAVPTEPALLGHHYRVVTGIFESARGNVYRAVDQRDGTNVVIKQARALVDETEDVGDIRLRLRNERRVLQALKDCPGIPRFLDHFRHGPDEFLVTSDVGPVNLAEDVTRDGPYPIGPDQGTGRSLERLGRGLAEILLGLHARGVVMRDLSPRNVVIDGDRISVIDFGVAGFDGLYLSGGTKGYAPARRSRGEPPRDTDDLHALAMTLLFATWGLRPVTLGDDADLPRRRALQAIRSAYGEEPAGIIGVIVDLFGGDDAARRALRRLATGEISVRTPGKVRRAGFLPAPPSVTPELAADIVGNLLADLVGQARGLLTGSVRARGAEVHRGMAGIGLELLEHVGEPGVAECLHDLAAASARAAPHLPPGLFHGRTGVDVFLSRARAHGIEFSGDHLAAYIPDAEWEPEGLDLISGAAGVGIGHLLLSDHDGDPAHDAIVQRCVRYVMDGGGLGFTADGSSPYGAASVAGLARGDAGAAGIGDALIDLAVLDDDPRRGDTARAVAVRILLRSVGPADHPVFVQGPGEAGAASLATGLAGILGFFRRLARHGGETALPMPSALSPIQPTEAP